MFISNLIISTILLILLLLLPFLFIKWLWNRRHLYMLSLKMPGPIGLPIIGTGFYLLSERQGFLIFLEKLSRRYDSNFCLWLGPKLYVVLTKCEDIELVLTSLDCINRANHLSKMLKDVVGDGMFSLEDDRWKKSRRIVAPSFNYSVIVKYIPIFDKQSRDCVSQLKKHVGNGPFNIHPIVEQATIFSFFQSTLAYDASPEIMLRYGKNAAAGHKLIGFRFFSPWYESDLLWGLSPHGRKQKKLKEESAKITEAVWSGLADSSFDSTLLQRLLRMSNERDSFTLDEIKTEITTVLLSGTESITGPTSIILMLLAMHQEVQDKVFEELSQIIPNQNSAITKDDLDKMDYLEMCMQEGLRLFPAVPITVRRNDRVLKLQNYDIPIGTSILIDFHQLHRNPAYWGPNANKFEPNNFLPANIANITPSTYLPFGLGPRSCIGRTYSIFIMKTMLANILRNYKITTHLKLKDLSVSSLVNIIVNNSSLMVEIEPRK